MWYNIVCVRGGVVASGFSSKETAKAMMHKMEKLVFYRRFMLKVMERTEITTLRSFSKREQKQIAHMAQELVLAEAA